MLCTRQSALKVDVTSLDTKAARRQPITVVVASNVTRSRDVVKMVVQKLGMDQQDLLLLQLVAQVNYRSRQMHTDEGQLSSVLESFQNVNDTSYRTSVSARLNGISSQSYSAQSYPSVREYVFYSFFFRFQKNVTFYVFKMTFSATPPPGKIGPYAYAPDAIKHTTSSYHV